MTRLRLIIPLFFWSLTGSAQLDSQTILKESCQCFSKKNENEIRNCIFKNDRLDRKGINSFLDKLENVNEFMRDFASNCAEAQQYFSEKWELRDSISDQEASRRIYEVVGYYRVITSETYSPKNINVPKDRIGLVFNTFRHRIDKNQMLEPGTHSIHWHDSLITFPTKIMELKSKFSCSNNANEILSLEASITYRLKKETLPEVYENMGVNYERIILEPNLRELVSNNCSEILNLKDKSEALEELKSQISGDYFIFEKMKIEMKK